MPFFVVRTNTSLRGGNVEAFLSAASSLIASELHKPQKYVVVAYEHNPQMIFGDNPKTYGVLAEMKSVGFADKPGLARLLTEFLSDRLANLDIDNINIEFVDMPASSLAIGGRMLG